MFITALFHRVLDWLLEKSHLVRAWRQSKTSEGTMLTRGQSQNYPVGWKSFNRKVC